MGMVENSQGKWLMGIRGLTRRKQVDSEKENKDLGHHGLAKRLNVIDLVGIGVGTTIGAGVYILIGDVAREQTGPALAVAFLIAGIAAALSAFCYAELSCRCPSAGSAYHYSYICIGEGVAWVIGWALILEYAIGGSVVARGVTPNLALYFGGKDNLPVFLARHTIFGIVVDPCAAGLVIIATILLCIGVKEIFSFRSEWSACWFCNSFFSYIGFDSVTATAEEVKNPKRDLPWGISISLALSCVLYMLLSFVIVGLVPYYKLDVDTPISSAFSVYGMEWAAYIVTTGAVTALLAALMGSLLPQSRILMAMARDGLLPPFFSQISKRTHVPVNGTIATGVLAAALSFFMNVSELAGMVSVGTLLAFTAVSVSVLIIRYIPPNEVPFLSYVGESSGTMGGHCHNMQEDEDIAKGPFVLAEDDNEGLLGKRGPVHQAPIYINTSLGKRKGQQGRNLAAFFISIVCVGTVVLAFSASAESLPSAARIALCGIGGAVFLAGLIGLTYLGEHEAADKFGHRGGFICPFVPYLPAASTLINTYLLINLGFGTWIRVSIWLLIGALVYLVYGRTHSSLTNTTYLHITHIQDVDP